MLELPFKTCLRISVDQWLVAAWWEADADGLHFRGGDRVITQHFDHTPNRPMAAVAARPSLDVQPRINDLPAQPKLGRRFGQRWSISAISFQKAVLAVEHLGVRRHSGASQMG